MQQSNGITIGRFIDCQNTLFGTEYFMLTKLQAFLGFMRNHKYLNYRILSKPPYVLGPNKTTMMCSQSKLKQLNFDLSLVSNSGVTQ